VKRLISTRKLKLAIVSDNKNEAYSFIRNENRNQNRALNVAYNHLYFEYIAQQKIKQSDQDYHEHLEKYKTRAKEKFDNFIKLKESAADEKKIEKAQKDYEKAQEKVYKIEREYNQKAAKIYQEAVGLAKQTRVRKVIEREFDLHYDTLDRITSKVVSDFNTDCKMGLLSGERSLRNYRNTNPLMVRARSMKLYEENGDFYIKWVKGITFKIILSRGSKQKANINELKSMLSRIIEGTYKMCDSSISAGKDLILILSVNIPVNKEHTFIPGRIVGVDLGLKIPAYVSLNDVPYIRRGIGSIDDFLKVRTKLQSQRRRLQKALQSTRGGKGRERKLKALERLKEREKNFVNTYNHFLSKKIVEFAVKHHAGIIHMEELKLDRLKHKSLLRNWSYYQLQNMVEYKAEREGIAVYYVDSSYTSQRCSQCGNLEEGQRVDQETFICKNCGFKTNADYNASQNIAKAEPLNIEKRKEEAEV